MNDLATPTAGLLQALQALQGLPPPLATRVTADELVLGLFAPPDEGPDATLRRLSPLLAALVALAPLPVRLVLFHEGAVSGPAEVAGLHLEVHPPASATGLRCLPQLEAALLPLALADRHQTLLTHLAIPTLVELPAPAAAGAIPGLAVAAATPRELAGLLLLLATDPPTRRRALDGQRRLLAAPDRRRWRVEGVFDSSYSLAIVNRHLALALADTAEEGESFALLTYEQGPQPRPNFAATEDPERVSALWAAAADPVAPGCALRNAWPPRVRDLRGARRILANYAWEETAFPEAFARDFNRVLDLITVVSTQTARLLQDAGVTVPIAVVGNGADPILRRTPAPLPRPLAAGFRFLHVSSCFPRKGVDVLLAAWGQAFRAGDPVLLVIKTFPNPHNDVLDQLARHRARDPGYPPVEVILDDWTPDQMAGLYRACQALVAPSRAEGFGLPIAEAMLLGLPCLVTGWGGHRDFCDPRTAWLIDYRLEPAHTHLDLPDSLWAEPDPDHLARLLREIHATTPAQRAPRLEAARRRVADAYTWPQVARRTRAALAVLDARPGPQPAPRVGWLSTWGSRCGIATYSSHLVRGFNPERLIVLAPRDETPLVADGPQVRRLWRRQRPDWDPLIAAVEREGLQALVIQHHWGFFGLKPLLDLLEQLHARRLPVFLEWHNTRDAPPELGDPRAQALLGACARLLVHNLDDCQRLQRLGLADNLCLFPLAVYPWTPPPAAELEALRGELGLTSRTLLASYGFLRAHKGLVTLVEAMPNLLARFPELHLLLVCARYPSADSAAEAARLTRRIADLGLAGRVTLEDRYLPEARSLALLSLADLIAFPYEHSHESSSAAVRTGIAAGRPIAVTPLRLFADVAPAVTTLPGTTPAEVAAGLATLLTTLADPEQARLAAERSRDHARRLDARRLAARLAGQVAGVLGRIGI